MKVYSVFCKNAKSKAIIESKLRAFRSVIWCSRAELRCCFRLKSFTQQKQPSVVDTVRFVFYLSAVKRYICLLKSCGFLHCFQALTVASQLVLDQLKQMGMLSKPQPQKNIIEAKRAKLQQSPCQSHGNFYFDNNWFDFCVALLCNHAVAGVR